MRPEKQAELAARYPHFFDHPESPVAPGRPGIQCGDEWFNVLDTLFSELTPLLEATRGLSNPPRLYEISLRHGRLHILLRPLTPEMSAIIYAATQANAM